MKYLVWTMALFASLSVLAGGAGWTVSKSCAKYVRIEGDRLFVDVPPGVTNVCAYATRPIDLSDFSQCMLEAHVRCRGENVVRDPRPARGVKLSLHYDDPTEGRRRYPCASAPEEGSFDWMELDLGVPFGEVPPSGWGNSQLVLGLQQTSGRLEFDLSSFSCRKAPPLFPSEDNSRLVRYPERIASLPRMRGVMGLGCCRNTEQDIEDLKNYGANLIRLQMNGFAAKRPLKGGKAKTLADWDRWLAKNLDHAEVVLGWLEKRGMMMVLDLHNPPLKGYGKDGDVFYVQANADRLVSAWREIAARFKGRKGIYGYDIMNEPWQNRRALPDCDYWNLQRRAASGTAPAHSSISRRWRWTTLSTRSTCTGRGPSPTRGRTGRRVRPRNVCSPTRTRRRAGTGNPFAAGLSRCGSSSSGTTRRSTSASSLPASTDRARDSTCGTASRSTRNTAGTGRTTPSAKRSGGTSRR